MVLDVLALWKTRVWRAHEPHNGYGLIVAHRELSMACGGLMIQRTRRVLAIVLAAVLASCDKAPPTMDGAACYPETARPWISAASSTGSAVRDPGGSFSIYLDGSASMAGFIRGSTTDEKPLADLIGLLPSLDSIDRSKLQIARFDRKISDLKPADISRMQTEAGYLCPASNRNCDAQESHIDQALGKIAANGPTSLAVVVSDLWLANSEVLTTDGVALSKPLADIFASGRSVAIYGFESPYAGRVNDLPSGNGNITASRHYLFLLVAGPVDRLQAFHNAMKNAPSRSIAGALGSGKAHYSLFTLDPIVAVADGTQPFDLEPKSPLAKASFLTVRTGVRVPQFHLDKAKVLRAADPGAVPGATWRGIPESRILPGAVWQGSSQGTTKLYRQSGDKCLPNGADWRGEGSFPAGWPGDGSSGFKLDASELATLPTGTYLLIGTVRRTSLQSPNPATQWMRDWSFDTMSEPEAVRRPVMPTLNLAETARLLEVALLKSAEAKPMKIGGFAVAVKID